MADRVWSARWRYLHVLVTVGSVVGVWASVGAGAALVAAMLAALELVWPGRRILATAALIALILVPLVWFAGSDLPLSPPAPRIQDNALAHHVGGLAVWLMFLAALLERDEGIPRPGTSRQDDRSQMKEDAS